MDLLGQGLTQGPSDQVLVIDDQNSLGFDGVRQWMNTALDSNNSAETELYNRSFFEELCAISQQVTYPLARVSVKNNVTIYFVS